MCGAWAIPGCELWVCIIRERSPDTEAPGGDNNPCSTMQYTVHSTPAAVTPRLIGSNKVSSINALLVIITSIELFFRKLRSRLRPESPCGSLSHGLMTVSGAHSSCDLVCVFWLWSRIQDQTIQTSQHSSETADTRGQAQWSGTSDAGGGPLGAEHLSVCVHWSLSFRNMIVFVWTWT